MSDKISIIVPCYNEEETVEIFHKEFFKRVGHMDVDFQLIFVDDGSKDDTLKLIKEIASLDDRVKYISFSRNFGKEAAMYAGLQNADGDYVAIMDVDLQDPPELIITMYDKLKNSDDIDCIASRRFTRKGEPVLRSFFAKTFYKLINSISETEVVDGARDFRLMTRQMCDSIIRLSEKRRFSKGLFSWVGFNTEWIKYENVERVAGSTKWNFIKLFKYAIDGIINFSTAPLNIPFVFSGIFFIASLVIGIISFCNLTNIDIALGIISAILFASSVLLLCGGILSMYINRIFTETKNRPIYIAKESNIIGVDLNE